MTQEEKAKAYDEAIKIIRSNLDALNEITETGAEVVYIQSVKNCFYKAFPKLKESKDERIRKELIAVINDLVLPDEQRTRFLSWLEKQGNPTKINPSEFDLRLNKLLQQFETLPKKELANSLGFYLNVVQNDGTYKEQGNYEFNGKITSRKSKGTLKKLIDEVEPKELSQSKETKISDKEWSEEDEVMCQETIDWFEQKCFPYASEEENPARKSIQWLKSLTQRLQ